MNFWRRLKLYGFGFALGLGIVYGMFGTRSCTSVNEMKMQELVFQEIQLSEKAKCKLRCAESDWIEKKYNKKVTRTDSSVDELYKRLLKIQLRHFQVNYDVSSPRKEPCGEYFVEPQKEFAEQYNFKMIMLDCDSITKINDIHISTSINCPCQ